MALTEPKVFILADHALLNVVQQIRDDHWDLEIPQWFPLPSSKRDTGVRLRTLINYHAFDDAWVPDMLAGHTMDDVGAGRFDGDLLGSDPVTNFAAIVEKACAAATQCDDLDRTVHCSFGDFPVRHYFWQINQFRALRARDIARLIGVDESLPDELLQGIWRELEPNVEEWRKIGVFGPPIAVADDAPLQDRLVALTGREP